MTKIILTPDTDYAAEVQRKLKENDYYCPCRLQKTPDTKCMCKEFRELKEGICHCGLYIKVITEEGK
jgi:ferredoxin-thioredoxin reductase catalytic subunit